MKKHPTPKRARATPTELSTLIREAEDMTLQDLGINEPRRSPTAPAPLALYLVPRLSDTPADESAE